MEETRKETVKSYRDLVVWQKGMDLVVLTYQISKQLPREEAYGLTKQMRRAASSVPSNIAEGYGRTHRGDYLHHLSISNGSLKELETQLLLSVRLGFCTEESVKPCLDMADEIGRMLAAMMNRLRAR